MGRKEEGKTKDRKDSLIYSINNGVLSSSRSRPVQTEYINLILQMGYYLYPQQTVSGYSTQIEPALRFL